MRCTVAIEFIVGATLATGLLWPATVAAAASEHGIDTEIFYGPLRARDLSPFGFLRLDMRPPFAGNTAPGSWSVETEVAYQNTWAVSTAAASYLESRSDRRPLNATDLAAIRGSSSENFLVDMELSQLDVLLHRQITDDWGAYVVLSGVHYGGGLLDSAIETFHDTFGMRNYGRQAVPRGQVNVFFDLDGAQYTALDAEPRTGLLDPTVGMRYTGVALAGPWQLVLEAAVKLPLAGERAWLSTGHVDTGLQATLVRRGIHHALYGNLALVHYAGTGGPQNSAERLLPTLVAGWELHVTGRTHSIVQLYASPSVYDRDETRLDELQANKYQLSVGFRHHRGPHLLTFAITENLGNLQNTPDVGMQFGWAYRPQH